MSYPRARGRRSALPEAAPVQVPPDSDAADLMPLSAALAGLHEGELCALIDSTNAVPQIVPGLSAWLGHACDWELNRRACVDFPLRPPDAAIPPEDQVASIVAVMMLRATFHRHAGRNGRAVVTLFDAMIGAIVHGKRWH